METIEIKGNVGDEICLKFNDSTLVIKLGENEIIPDFTSAADAFSSAPYQLLSALNSVFHNGRGSKEKLVEVISWYRDAAFAKIAPAPKEAPTPEKKTTKKTSKKTETASTEA